MPIQHAVHNVETYLFVDERLQESNTSFKEWRFGCPKRRCHIYCGLQDKGKLWEMIELALGDVGGDSLDLAVDGRMQVNS